MVLMHNFTSIADALEELVDNAIDFRLGQKLTVNIVADERQDLVIVESDGGRGMGAQEIGEWLNWGEGEQHDVTHIGMYHQGGKAACGFLARHVRLYGKKNDDDRVWLLEDEDWATRSEARDFGEPSPLHPDEYPDTMRTLPLERGHVRIELAKLNRNKPWTRGTLEKLKCDLSSTYRCLLANGDVAITINGDAVPGLDLPLKSTATHPVKVKLPGGRKVSGWAGRMNRNDRTRHVKSGLRLVYNGRLIKEGEWFGYNYEGKGALNTLIGELHMKGFTPNPNKTDFIDRSETVWDDLGQQVLDQLAPLISELRKSSEELRVTKAEKDRAREVADELETAMRSLREMPELPVSERGNGASGGAGEGGRRPPTPRPPRPTEPNPRGPSKRPRQPRTPPSDDAVGRLVRLLDGVMGGTRVLPLRIRSWHSSERFAWTPEGDKRWLDINKSYPLYRALKGSKPYLAETATLALCQPQETDSMSASEYMEKVNVILLQWAQVARLTAPDAED